MSLVGVCGATFHIIDKVSGGLRPILCNVQVHGRTGLAKIEGANVCRVFSHVARICLGGVEFMWLTVPVVRWESCGGRVCMQ